MASLEKTLAPALSGAEYSPRPAPRAGSALAGALSTPRVLAAGEAPAPASHNATHTTGAITFDEVVERYHGKVFQLVYRYTGDYEEACDLTQDTFVRAYRAWREFRGESQVYTWLYRIALNLCHNSRKKGDRKRRVEGPSLDVPAYDSDDKSSSFDVPDVRAQPSRSIENDELRAHLHKALIALPDNYRTVIVLRDIEGLPYEEIARITDSSLEAIKSRLFRARGLLRELLAPYLFGTASPAETPARSSAWKNKPRRSEPRP